MGSQGALLPMSHDTPSNEQSLEDTPALVVSGRVKWFDAVKGYGFIMIESPDEDLHELDVMIHVSILRKFGISAMTEESEVTCQVVRRPKGLQAVQIVSYEPHAIEDDDGSAEFETVSVKWFNRAKGFGFVNRADMPDTDVFIHMVVIRKAGLDDLTEGQSLSAVVEGGPKGYHVKAIKV